MFLRPDRQTPRITTQLLLVQVLVLLLVLSAGFALTALLLKEQSEDQYLQRALAVARTTADTPLIINSIADGHDQGEVQRLAEHIRQRTGMLFVVVADAHGIRHSHPDPAEVGRRVSTPPTATGGAESASVEMGTLGKTARAKVPILASDGRVIGQVSAGIKARAAYDAARPLIWTTAGFALGSLLLGTAAAVLAARRLKRQTLGLEPADLADLLRKQEAVISGIGDGVLAVDESGCVTVCNEAAADMFGEAPPPGTLVAQAAIPAILRRTLASRHSLHKSLLTIGGRLLIVTAQPVRRGGHDLGQVMTLRDRTELDELERELAALQALSDALRAQAHEYTNRLHTLSGMLTTGTVEDVQTYLRELATAPLATEARDGGRLADPYLRGLLAAKTATASEQGIELRLVPDSYLPRRLTEPLGVVTIVGNLLENAIRAAGEGIRKPAWIEINILIEGATLHVSVVDSGNGVAAEAVDRLFDHGFTTRPAPNSKGHGIGLTLARQLAAKHNGELRLERSRGDDHGAVFIARLPDVVEPPLGCSYRADNALARPSKGDD